MLSPFFSSRSAIRFLALLLLSSTACAAEDNEWLVEADEARELGVSEFRVRSVRDSHIEALVISESGELLGKFSTVTPSEITPSTEESGDMVWASALIDAATIDLALEVKTNAPPSGTILGPFGSCDFVTAGDYSGICCPGGYFWFL